MKLVVLGAGSSYQQCVSLGLKEEHRLPLLNQMAEKLWKNGFTFQSHEVILRKFLENPEDTSKLNDILTPEVESRILYKSPSEVDFAGFIENQVNFEPDHQLLEKFLLQEKVNPETVNIERLFQFLWILVQQDKRRLLPVWKNFVHLNLLQPLKMMILDHIFSKQNDCFPYLADLNQLSKSLIPGDIVFNLNYDTLFEVALDQSGKKYTYSPFPMERDRVYVVKPHGSINMALKTGPADWNLGVSFQLDPLNYLGGLPTNNMDIISSVIPPRKGKTYQQHPVSVEMFKTIKAIKPDHVIFWGLGFAQSDKDLNDFYRNCCVRARKVDFINPSHEDCQRAQAVIRKKMRHYGSLTDWLKENN